jgi:hypothetical protein
MAAINEIFSVSITMVPVDIATPMFTEGIYR